MTPVLSGWGPSLWGLDKSGDISHHAPHSTQGTPPGQLNLHAGNGPPMMSKTLALKPADLGVTKSHSRPYVSDDSPFAESQFKALEYRPEFQYRFGSLEDARAHGQNFFHWYNLEHHYSGIAILTPHMGPLRARRRCPR